MQLKNTLLVSALTLSLALGGCNSTSGVFGGSADPDPRLTNKDFNVESSSYVTSCLVGAGLLGATCLFIADSSKRAICVAAAAAGCAAFMGGNALLDNLRESYHTKEAQLDALASRLSDNRQKALLMASAAKEVYKDDQVKFKQLQKDIKSNKASSEQIKKSIAQYDANIKVLKENIEYHEKSMESFRTAKTELVGKESLTAAERSKLKECDRQIVQLQKSIDDLRNVYAANVQDRNVLNLTLEKGTEVKAQELTIHG